MGGEFLVWQQGKAILRVWFKHAEIFDVRVIVLWEAIGSPNLREG